MHAQNHLQLVPDPIEKRAEKVDREKSSPPSPISGVYEVGEYTKDAVAQAMELAQPEASPSSPELLELSYVPSKRAVLVQREQIIALAQNLDRVVQLIQKSIAALNPDHPQAITATIETAKIIKIIKTVNTINTEAEHKRLIVFHGSQGDLKLSYEDLRPVFQDILMLKTNPQLVGLVNKQNDQTINGPVSPLQHAADIAMALDSLYEKFESASSRLLSRIKHLEEDLDQVDGDLLEYLKLRPLLETNLAEAKQALAVDKTLYQIPTAQPSLSYHQGRSEERPLTSIDRNYAEISKRFININWRVTNYESKVTSTKTKVKELIKKTGYRKAMIEIRQNIDSLITSTQAAFRQYTSAIEGRNSDKLNPLGKSAVLAAAEKFMNTYRDLSLGKITLMALYDESKPATLLAPLLLQDTALQAELEQMYSDYTIAHKAAKQQFQDIQVIKSTW